MIKVLQGATATAGKVFTLWFHTIWRSREHLHRMGFIVVALLIMAAKRHLLTGQCPLDKTGFPLETTHPATIVNKVDNLAN